MLNQVFYHRSVLWCASINLTASLIRKNRGMSFLVGFTRVHILFLSKTVFGGNANVDIDVDKP